MGCGSGTCRLVVATALGLASIPPDHLRAQRLAQCLARVSSLCEEERRQMSRASYTLSLQFTPDRWASTLVQGLLALK